MDTQKQRIYFMKTKWIKIYYCVILTLRNFEMDEATKGSKVYKPWLVFRRFLWVWMMADSIIFLSVKLLLHLITELRSKLILWLKPLICWKSALFSCPDLIEYLCCFILASSDLPVWPSYTSGQFAHGILYM